MNWRNGGRTYAARGVLAGPPDRAHARLIELRQTHQRLAIDCARKSLALIKRDYPLEHGSVAVGEAWAACDALLRASYINPDTIEAAP
jgi:hypothetical protein